MQFIYPQLLWGIPIVAALLLILLRIELVKLPVDKRFLERRRRLRIGLFLSRLAILSLLLLALAQPYQQVSFETAGEPRLTVLVDNSTSMALFAYDPAPLVAELRKQLPTKVRYAGGGERSPVGDGIITNLKENEHFLLVSDGRVTGGLSLGDAALTASSLNSSLSAIDLTPTQTDVSVWVEGPSRVISGVENTFRVHIRRFGMPAARITATLDGEALFDQDTDKEVLEFKRSFDEGYHRLEARAAGDDLFPQNNAYFHTIKVIPRPKVLLLTERETPLLTIFNELYETTTAANLPANVSDHYALVLNDIPAAKLTPAITTTVKDYLTEGNGMVVIGSFNSFDRGKYKGSLFETLLPVTTGTAEKKRGDSDIMVLIDISGSTSGYRRVLDPDTLQWIDVKDEYSQLDIMKAFAVNLLKDLNVGNQVGALAFAEQVYAIESIRPLYDAKTALIDKISRITPPQQVGATGGILGGASNLDPAIQEAFARVSTQKRNRVVIILSDGNVNAQAEILARVRAYAAAGVKFYTIGVARNDASINEPFLQAVAEEGYGVYLRAKQLNKLKVLFGDPEDVKQGETFSLFVINSNHFITRGLAPTAQLNGFNQVIPRGIARLLVTSTAGDPALTVWNFGGLGRVAALTVFSGPTLGELLNAENSILLSRTVNWAIGDPERKQPYVVTIEDGRINEPFTIQVTSDEFPEAADHEFTRTGERTYESDAFFVEQPGFHTFSEATFAANAPLEYQETGLNPGLVSLAGSTGGKIFKPSQVNEIVEHVQKLSRRTITKRVYLVWPLLVVALVIFLFEILLRKLHEFAKHGQRQT